MSDFDHDVFISYAFVDDVDGWVRGFDKHFQGRLDAAIGRSDPNRVYFASEKINNDQSLREQIVRKVTRSRLLVILLSPGYVASEWCRREREAFLNQFPKAIQEERVVLIDLGKLGLADRPPEFEDLLGHNFFVPDTDEPDCGTTFGFPVPVIGRTEHDSFFYSVDKLAIKLARRLKRFKSTDVSADATIQTQAISSQTSSRPMNPGGVVAAVAESANNGILAPTIPHPEVKVFVAQATGDVFEERNAVARHLADYFTVFPPIDEEFPREWNEWSKLVQPAILQADFYVQLVSAIPGKALAGSTQRPVLTQFEWARDANKPMVLWRGIDPDEVADPDLHKVLLAADYCQTLQEFKDEIVRRAKPVAPKPAKQHVDPANDEICNVFIHAAIEDVEQANQLAALISQYNCFAHLPLHDGSPDEIRRDLEENLDLCDALIVFYGKVPQRTIRAQFLELPKHLYRRKRKALSRPTPAIAIFDGEPAPKSPLGVHIAGLQWINSADPTFQEKVVEWVNAIRMGGAS